MHGTHVPSTLSRRHFILTAATAAGGFMIGIGATPRAAGAATVGIAPGSDENAYSPNDIDAWIAIDPDDSILIRYQRSEMGQGSMTALPMMIAEELHCDWSKVRIEYASPNRNLRENKVYGPMFSHGSMSVRTSQKKVQQVGASARERLIAAAAARWNVPASECSAAQSVVTHKPSGQSLRFGELAADAAKVTLAAEPAIKTPAQFTFIPKPLPRVDVVHKTDGSGKFGIDAQVPGMVFAAITACPVPGGKLKSVDDSVLNGAPGVLKVVKLPNAVAVVATDTYWRAKRALSRLQPEWDVGAAGKVDSDKLSQMFRAALNEPMLTARNDGNVDQVFSGAAKTFEAIYETPYLSHSPMEPMNATVNLQPDRLDVWVGTQDAAEALEAAAKASGLKPERVYIHNGFLGGGFGRRDANDEVKQAIAIAKAVQRPVKLVWTREEDTRQDKFRPHAVVGFKAAVGIPRPANKVEPQTVAGLADNGYNVPNMRVESLVKNTHLPVWFWRAPGINQHIFAIESFLDEMAAASGIDPYQMRRKLLEGKPRLAQGVGYRRGEGRLGQAVAKRQRPRHRHLHGLRQSMRASRRGHCQAGRPGEGQSRHGRARYPLHGQSADHRRTGRGRRDLWLDRRALRQDHDQGRRAGAGQFRYLPHGAPCRGAEDRRPSGAERRQGLGRRRRACYPADPRRGGERDLRGHRQAPPFAANQRSRSDHRRLGIAGRISPTVRRAAQ